MVIVSINGQLGNQMFQYAVGYKNQLLGHRVKYELFDYIEHPNHWALDRFGITVSAATRKEVLRLKDEYSTIPDRIRRKILGRHPRVVSEIGRKEYFYDAEVFAHKRMYIDGYWQSEKYFEDIEEEIRKLYTFPNSENPKNSALADELKNGTSVSIHVRRGDYLGGFPVMDMDYYIPAMKYFKEKYENVKFYIFSNDLKWCRDNFINEDVTFIDWNTGKDSIFDMYLMTQCKHNIIANSTFSWWGAWLNTNPGHEVIAPKVWFYNTKTPAVYCKDWIKL